MADLTKAVGQSHTLAPYQVARPKALKVRRRLKERKDLAERSTGWQTAREGLVKRFTFTNRRCRAAFLERLSAYANQVNHHPDVTTSDLDATVTYVTHSAGDTITDKDHDGAREADRIAALPDVVNLEDREYTRDEAGRFAETAGVSTNPSTPRGDPTGVGPSEAFRREVGTTADEMRAEPPPKTLSDAESRVRGEPNEHGFLMKDGVATYFGSDKKNVIIITPPPNLRAEDLGGEDDPLSDGVFTHNHPSGGALSPDDCLAAAVHNMKEIRAVVPGGAYSLRRVGSWWPPVGQLQRIVEVESEEVHKDFVVKIGTGVMTVAEANAVHWKTVWPRVVKEVQAITAPSDPRIAFSFEPEES